MDYRNELGNWEEIILEPSGDTLPVGSIAQFGGATAPTNWLFCNGQAVSRETYAELFSVIGTTYGEGDGSTTFNVPDFIGRVPVGLDKEDTDFDTLGETGGEKTHKLTISEMPAHKHGAALNSPTTTNFSGSNVWGVAYSKGSFNQAYIDETGGSQAHNNMQPYTVTNFIIKSKQSVGLVGAITDNINDTNDNAVPNTKTVKEYVDKAILFVKPSADKNPTASQYVQMNNLEIVDGVNYDGKLSISNGKILIGEGLSKIRIKRIINVTGTTGSGWDTLYSYIVKNNSNAQNSWQYIDFPAIRTTVLTAENIVDVTEGDIITVSTYCGLAYKLNTNATKIIIEEL